jgi:hypothetical protein
MNTIKRIGATLSIALFIMAAAGGCANAAFSPPPALSATQFLQADLYQLQLDYYQNPVAADALYLGKIYYFGAVRAEQVTSIFDVHGSEDYVLSGNVKFKPLASKDMKGIIQGTWFEVSGTIRGVEAGYIVVSECWYKIQSGGASYQPGGAY